MALPSNSSLYLRDLIDKCVPTDADLEAFCLDFFPEVKRRFGASQDHIQKVNLLLEVADHRVIHEVLVNRYHAQGKRSSGKPKYRSLLFAGIIIVLLILAIIFVLLIYLGVEYLIVIRDLASIEIKSENAYSKQAREIFKNPDDFASSLEHIAVKQLGLANALIVSYREFDIQRKIWMRGIVVIDKRSNKPVIFTLIPEVEVKAWIYHLSLRQPWAREIAIEAIRASEKAPYPTTGTTNDSSVIINQKSDTHESQKTNDAMSSSSSNERKKSALNIAKEHPTEIIHYQPDMGSLNLAALDLAAQPQSLVEAVKPKIIPAALMISQQLYHPIPDLPQEIREQWLCSRFTMMHKICVKNDGTVGDIETKKSIWHIDNYIKNTLQSWRFKPRENPVCYINFLSYQIDDGTNCEKAEIDLPNETTQNPNSTRQDKTIPMILIKKDKIRGDDPHLPDHVKSGKRGNTITGSYKVCISTGGVIYKVEPVNSINKATKSSGADENVIKAVYTWKYKPQPIPICFMQFFEFHIE